MQKFSCSFLVNQSTHHMNHLLLAYLCFWQASVVSTDGITGVGYSKINLGFHFNLADFVLELIFFKNKTMPIPVQNQLDLASVSEIYLN